jgi:diguanylate cyclase (GGDEF)-like protein/putative nucleotidyltransferase with HDIG domain
VELAKDRRDMQASGVPRGVGSMMECSVEGGDGQGLLHGGPVMETVQRSYEVAVREGSGLSVIVAGLDGFRAVNDRLGPIEGDVVLAAFAARLSGQIERVTHLVSDQLLGVLPGATPSKAGALAQALQKDIADNKLTAVGRLTASFGMASYPESVESAQELVYGAQAAMYLAKAKGGNGVDCWGEMIGANTSIRQTETGDPVTALAAALERKTRTGAGQLMRSAWYARQVAAEMGLGPEERELVEKAALLHDVGKLAVPDEILQKRGPLSEEEMAVVRAHPAVGAKIVTRIPELAATAPIIAHHHEHVDGSGYPDGLVGDAIPLISRIILVSDATDAMTTQRSHKNVISLQEALQELHQWSGSQFDKRVVDAFTTIVNRRGLKALHWSQLRRQHYPA